MKYDRMNRRMFLQGSGSLLAVPFLPSLFSSTAKAAVILPKSIHISSPWCLPREHTYPLYLRPDPAYSQPANTSPASVPWVQKDADTKFQSLASIIAYQGQISYTLDKKWNPFATRMNLVTNAHAYVADNKFNSRIPGCASSDQNGSLPSDNANGPAKGYAYSVDYLLENAIYRSSASPAIKTLRVNPALLNPSEQLGSFSYGTIGGVDTRLPMLRTLRDLASALGAANGGSLSSSRKTRIDSVLEDFKKLMNHRRISGDDKQRLSQAADMWSALESKSACNAPSLNPNETNWRLIHQQAMDAVVMALACGLTRNVAYGLIQSGDAQYDMPGVADPRVAGESSPSITDPYYASHLRWRSDLVTSFLSKLDATLDENGQSLLNSTLAVWAHSTSNGNHGLLGHSLISVGNVNSRLETGWHVDAGGAPINKFHLTNMMAVGLSLSDIEKSGRAGFGEYSAQSILAAGGVSTGEKDYKVDDPQKRSYDYSKRDHFFTDVEKRRAFPYLK